MMTHSEHPSDETLLRALDGEPSPSTGMAPDAHVARCERCRARLRQIQATADEASAAYRESGSSQTVDPAALRRRLQLAMDDLSGSWDRSPWHRMRRGLAAVPLVIRASACLAAAVLVVHSSRPTAMPVSPGAVALIASGARPIHAITPGATASVGVRALCTAKPVRSSIPAAVRSAVLSDYQMEHVSAQEYELDFLITPELGGVADQRNLWPERYASGAWNAGVKDDLERLLPDLVCQGALDLTTAQRDIAEDWIAAYEKYFKTDRPLSQRLTALEADDDDRAGGIALLQFRLAS